MNEIEKNIEINLVNLKELALMYPNDIDLGRHGRKFFSIVEVNRLFPNDMTFGKFIRKNLQKFQ